MTYFPESPTSENDSLTAYQGWRRGRPGVNDQRTSFLFWLTVLGVGCVSLLCVTWGASSLLAQKGSEKLLRVELLLPKLKSVHMSELAHSAMAHLKDRNTTATVHPLPAVVDHEKVKILETPHQTATEEPWQHLIPPLEWTHSPVVETCGEPVVYINPCTPQRGDSPMIRTWKTLTMYSLLTAATVTFVSEPNLAFGGEQKETTLKASEIEGLRTDIQTLTRRIAELEKKPGVKVDKAEFERILADGLKKLEDGALTTINQSIQGVKTDVTSVQTEQRNQAELLKNHKFLIDLLTEQQKKLLVSGGTASPTPMVDKTFMEEFRGSLRTLNETIAKLGPTEKRLSMSPPNGSPIATTGRVMLINLYSNDVLFVVNGTPIAVRAGTQRVLENIPAGTLRYEVMADRWGILENRVTTLAAGDTFTLTASNRP